MSIKNKNVKDGILVMGLTYTGKTAYLASLCYRACSGGLGQLPFTTYLSDKENLGTLDDVPIINANQFLKDKLGEEKVGEAWQANMRNERTKVIQLFNVKVKRSFMKFNVWSFDLAGENWNFLAHKNDGDERGDDSKEIQVIRDSLLPRTSAFMLLIDPFIEDVGQAADSFWQGNWFQEIYKRTPHLQKKNLPIPVAFVLTKSDRLFKDNDTLDFEIAEADSRYVEYVRSSGLFDDRDISITSGIARIRIGKRLMLDESLMNAEESQALSWDVLRAKSPDTYSYIDALVQDDRFDVSLHATSAWGGVLPQNEDGIDMVPRVQEIDPSRVLQPLGNLVRGIVRRKRTLRQNAFKKGLAYGMMALLTLGPISYHVIQLAASLQMKGENWSGASSLLQLESSHPYGKMIRGIWSGWKQDHLVNSIEVSRKLMTKGQLGSAMRLYGELGTAPIYKDATIQMGMEILDLQVEAMKKNRIGSLGVVEHFNNYISRSSVTPILAAQATALLSDGLKSRDDVDGFDHVLEESTPFRNALLRPDSDALERERLYMEALRLRSNLTPTWKKFVTSTGRNRALMAPEQMDSLIDSLDEVGDMLLQSGKIFGDSQYSTPRNPIKVLRYQDIRSEQLEVLGYRLSNSADVILETAAQNGIVEEELALMNDSISVLGSYTIRFPEMDDYAADAKKRIILGIFNETEKKLASDRLEAAGMTVKAYHSALTQFGMPTKSASNLEYALLVKTAQSHLEEGKYSNASTVLTELEIDANKENGRLLEPDRPEETMTEVSFYTDNEDKSRKLLRQYFVNLRSTIDQKLGLEGVDEFPAESIQLPSKLETVQDRGAYDSFLDLFDMRERAMVLVEGQKPDYEFETIAKSIVLFHKYRTESMKSDGAPESVLREIKGIYEDHKSVIDFEHPSFEEYYAKEYQILVDKGYFDEASHFMTVMQNLGIFGNDGESQIVQKVMLCKEGMRANAKTDVSEVKRQAQAISQHWAGAQTISSRSMQKMLGWITSTRTESYNEDVDWRWLFTETLFELPACKMSDTEKWRIFASMLNESDISKSDLVGRLLAVSEWGDHVNRSLSEDIGEAVWGFANKLDGSNFESEQDQLFKKSGIWLRSTSVDERKALLISTGNRFLDYIRQGTHSSIDLARKEFGQFRKLGTYLDIASTEEEFSGLLEQTENYLGELGSMVKIESAGGEGVWLGKYEVSVAEYEQFRKASINHLTFEDPKNHDGFDPQNWDIQLNHPDRPVVMVDYYDALTYCMWKGGRLPTDEEWKSFAYAGNSKYPHGDSTNIQTVDKKMTTPMSTRDHTTRDRKQGVLMLTGNVSEWTTPKEGFSEKLATLIGGNFDSNIRFAERSDRASIKPKTTKTPYLGFRMVLPSTPTFFERWMRDNDSRSH